MTVSDSPELLGQIPEILHERVRRHWQDWQQKQQAAGHSDDPGVDLGLLGKIWGCSEFAANNMVRYPELWFELLESGLLDRSIDLDDYSRLLQQRLAQISILNDAELMRHLRLFRQQHMLRIAWRDLAQQSETAETLRNLTELAEASVDQTLELLYQDQCQQLGTPCNHEGQPQRMVVLGMGKMGGNELNYSSDIDLIFCFPEEGETRGGRTMAASQFFIRLGQRLIRVLNDVTAEGFVFRVDMRLRPYGDSGPLVMSHDAMEQYYQTQGRDWERYAMIKARVIGGDRQEGQAIMEMLRPFIYRRYLDFGAFASIRDMKALIDTEIRRKGNLNNIKLGRGGIREIEFVGQTFQLIRGGGEPELRIRGIVDVLRLLAKKRYLSQEEVTQLLESYDFLRRLENRLQMYADAQTHLLPSDPGQQASMALAMGYDDWSSLLADCDAHRKSVHRSFVQLLHEDEEDEPSADTGGDFRQVWLLATEIEDGASRLEQLGMAEADEVMRQLQLFQQSAALRSITITGRQRLDTLMPALLSLLAGEARPAIVLQRLMSLIQSILKRSVYLSLLNEYPAALRQLVELCAASPWIAHLLSRYPVLLDELLDSRSLYQVRSREELAGELESLLAQVGDDEEQQLERLRKFRQTQVLRIAAMDIAGVQDVFDVSDQLTLIAEVLLEKVMALAWDWMIAKHGRPVCEVEGKRQYPSMGIVAYGKMGGEELGYGSDLDLVFLHNSQGEKQQSDGGRPLENASYFARLAQRIIHLLSVQTANGRLYEIDMRLRPDGNAGMLVSSLQAYEIYQREKAWTWEHQALVRARIVCADTHLEEEFGRIRRAILTLPRDRLSLATEVVEMRRKMRDALGSKPGSQGFHLKQDEGGLVDIEFIAQYGVLLYAREFSDLTTSTATRVIIGQLAECRMLTQQQAEQLIQAYRQYRIYSHQLALQEQSSQIDENPVEKLREVVKVIWSEVLSKYAETE